PAGTDGDEMILSAQKDRRETLRARVVGDKVILRRGEEPVALAFHPALARYFHLDPVELEDRAVLSFDPYRLSAIVSGAERVERGATSDDWKLTAPVAAAADVELVERLRDVAAELRAKRVERRAPEGEWRRVSFVIEPAPGAAAGSKPETLAL